MSDDKDFHQLHETIIRKATDQKNMSLHNSTVGGSGSSSPGRICVTLKFLIGEAGQLRVDQSALFKNVIEVRRLGFPNVIMPGDVRLVKTSMAQPLVFLLYFRTIYIFLHRS